MKIEFRQSLQSRESSDTQDREQTVRIEINRTEINRGGRLAELEMLGRQNAFRVLSNLQTSGVNSFAASTHETRNQELLERGLDPLISTDAAASGDRETAWRSISDSINTYYDAEIADVRANRSIPRFEREELISDLESQRSEHLSGARAEFDKNYNEALRAVNRNPAYRSLPPEDKEAIAVSEAARAWNARVEEGERILDELKNIDASTDRATLDALRQDIADYFGPAGMRNSHQLMEAVRDEGLLDNFLRVTLRNQDNRPVGSDVRDAVRLMLETGRLDVYAETLATTPISLYSATDTDYASFGGNHVFFGGSTDLPRGIYLNRASLGTTQELANVMAHELFHAYNEAHGNISGALNEGFGIAAREYAFSNTDYNLAEMVYGTKNFYRDIWSDPTYPLGQAGTADAELREFLNALASRDSSELAWNDPTQLEDEYNTFFEPLNRNVAWNDWLLAVEQATQDMLAAR